METRHVPRGLGMPDRGSGSGFVLGFDWNGTLVDDLDRAWHAASDVLEEEGIRPPTRTEFADGFELPLSAMFARFGAAPHNVGQCELRWNLRMSDEVPPRLVPGALETLAALTRLNVDLIVISATASVVVHGDLRALGLQRNFDFVFGGTPTKLSALRALTASGESRWLGYIGDTEHDVAAAQQAGMPSIAYAGGYRPRSALESVSPDFMLEHLAEVVPIVEAMLS